MSKEKPLFLLIILYIILTPFYFWESGIPQVSDFILLLAIIYYLLMNYKKIDFNGTIFLITSIFLFYILIINFLWFLKIDDFTFVKVNLVYIFNSLVFFAFISISIKYGIRRIFKVLYVGVSISILIQFLLFITIGNANLTRTTLFFNNPNQLGYYGLLSISIMFLANNHLKLSPLFFYINMIFGFILVFVSASKGALLGVLIIIFSLLIFNKTNMIIKVFEVITLMILVAISYLFVFNPEILIGKIPRFDSIITRLVIEEKRSNNLAVERGYIRIVENPEYAVFGAGEGAIYRFNTTIELHSTFGNILFSYGIVGLLMFSTIIFYALFKNPIYNLIPLFSTLIYGITHNGIRESLFWILLALIISVANKQGFIKENDKVEISNNTINSLYRAKVHKQIN